MSLNLKEKKHNIKIKERALKIGFAKPAKNTTESNHLDFSVSPKSGYKSIKLIREQLTMGILQNLKQSDRGPKQQQ